MYTQTRFLYLLLFLYAMPAVAQKGYGSIEGHVRDGLRNIVASATVSLFHEGDTLSFRRMASDKEGGFRFPDVLSGNYYVTVSSLGYTDYHSGILPLRSGSMVRLDSVSLTPVSREMQAVTIVSKKPPMEFKAGKTVVNVENSVSNTGATVLEILEKSPGVVVDKDGNISLKGKNNVMVMIDDKLTYLSGTQLSDLLSSMNASQLQQIELMTNPSSAYDAAGNAGIINIKTKKNSVKGFNGNANLGYGQGIYARGNGGLNLNYRDGKYNFFLNYNGNSVRDFNDLRVLRKYLDTDGKSIQQWVASSNLQQIKDMTNTLKLGMDYYLSSATTLGITATGFTTDHQINSNSTVYVEEPDRAIDSTSYDAVVEKKTILNGTLNLNAQHRFDTSRQLTGNLDYIRYDFSDAQHFYNDTYLPDGSASSLNELRGNLPTHIFIYSGKLDYSQTLRKGVKLQAGWKSSAVKTDNIADYDDLDGGAWIPDYGKTNHFIYREDINAFYTTFDKTFRKWTIQAGLRYENTNSHGHQLGNPGKPDSAFTRKYNDLFPTVFITYDQNKDNQWTLSTGRRIDRPAYQDLNPFLFYINQYTYQVGNPFLIPQYTYNFELSYIYKGIFTTTLNYSNTRNYFNEILNAHHDTTILTSGNIRKYESAGISVSAQLVLAPWWTAVLQGNLDYIVMNAYIPGSGIYSASASGQLNVNNQLTFKKGWSGELSGFYNSPAVVGQNSSDAFGQVAAGISKQLFRNKWTAKLNVRDLFHTGYYTGGVQYQNVRVRYSDVVDSRIVNVALIWRFGKPLKETRTRNEKEVQEESRVRTQ